MSERSESNGGGGIRTQSSTPDTLLQRADKNTTETVQSLADINTYENQQNTDFEQKLTLSKHSSDTIIHQKCAKCVHKNLPGDLREVVDRWDELPGNVKEAISLLIK